MFPLGQNSKKGGLNVKSLSLNIIMGYILAREQFAFAGLLLRVVHLDSDCVCTTNVALLLQATICACTVYTSITTRVVSLS